MFRSHRRAQILLLAAGTLAITLTACSGAGDPRPTGRNSGSTSAGSAGSATPMDPVELWKKASTGVIGSVTTTPTTVPAGKSVWIVSCGQVVAGCSAPAAGIAAAAKAVGWTSHVCDGQLNPAGWAACIRQGIGTNLDVMTVVGLDCPSVLTPLQEAARAGIITVGVGGNNCPTGGYTGVVQKLPGMGAEDLYKMLGALQADWLIARTGAKAKVLSLQFTDLALGTWVQKGFVDELATCSGCRVVRTLPIRNQDIGSGALPATFSAALQQNPAINAVNVPIDGWFVAGLAQAVQSSGRSDQLAVIGAFGEPGNLDLIRHDGGEDATVAWNETWDGWGGIDAAIRLLNKQPVQPEGIGLQVVDRDTNMPPAGQAFAYHPSIDFVAAYRRVWTPASSQL